MTVQWILSVPRSDEQETETPHSESNLNRSAAGLQLQPDWISVGVNGRPRGNVAK